MKYLKRNIEQVFVFSIKRLHTMEPLSALELISYPDIRFLEVLLDICIRKN